MLLDKTQPNLLVYVERKKHVPVFVVVQRGKSPRELLLLPLDALGGLPPPDDELVWLRPLQLEPPPHLHACCTMADASCEALAWPASLLLALSESAAAPATTGDSSLPLSNLLLAAIAASPAGQEAAM